MKRNAAVAIGVVVGATVLLLVVAAMGWRELGRSAPASPAPPRATTPRATARASAIATPSAPEVAAVPSATVTLPPPLPEVPEVVPDRVAASAPDLSTEDEPRLPDSPPSEPEIVAAATANAEEAAARPPELSIPVDGVAARDLTDTYTQARGEGRVHDAIDIMAPRGTPVRAAASGRIAKLFTSVPGGLTVYQFDVTETYVLYYAHLDAYAPGLAEDQFLQRGDMVGFVGSTGNAIETAPHLHFSVGILGPEKRWWKSTPLNPYELLNRPVSGNGLGR